MLIVVDVLGLSSVCYSGRSCLAGGWLRAGTTRGEVPPMASFGQEPISNAVSGSQSSLGFLTEDLCTGCPSSSGSLLPSPSPPLVYPDLSFPDALLYPIPSSFQKQPHDLGVLDIFTSSCLLHVQG